MIVTFAPSAEEVAEAAAAAGDSGGAGGGNNGSRGDGGLRAAVLRALTCAAELGERFGAMRMLPNGDVAAVLPAEREALAAADAAAAAAAAAQTWQPFTGPLADVLHHVAAPAVAAVDGARHVTVAAVSGARAVSVAAAGALLPVSHGNPPRSSMHADGKTGSEAGSVGPRDDLPADFNSASSSGIQRAYSASDTSTGDKQRQAQQQQQHARSPPQQRIPRGLPRRSSPGSLGLGARSHAPDLMPPRQADLQQATLDRLRQLTQHELLLRPPELPHRGGASDGSFSRLTSPGASATGSPPSTGRQPLRSATAPTHMSETLRGYAAAAVLSRAGSHGALLPGSAPADSMLDGQPSLRLGEPARLSPPRHRLSMEQVQRSQSMSTPFASRAGKEWTEDPCNDHQQLQHEDLAGSASSPSSRRLGSLFGSLFGRAGSGSRRGRSKSTPGHLNPGVAAMENDALHLASGIHLETDAVPAAWVAASGTSMTSPIRHTSNFRALIGRVSTSVLSPVPTSHLASHPANHSQASAPSTAGSRRRKPSSGQLPLPQMPHAAMGGTEREESEEAAIERTVLSLKVLLAAGTVCIFHVGGAGGSRSASGSASAVDDPGSWAEAGALQWEIFIGDAPHAPAPATATAPTTAGAGADSSKRQPMAQLAAIEGAGVRGQTVLSAEVAALVGGAAELRPLPEGGAALLLCLPERHLLPPRSRPTSPDPLRPGHPSRETASEAAALAALSEGARAAAIQALRCHLLENVRARIEAGHIDYVNEVRQEASAARARVGNEHASSLQHTCRCSRAPSHGRLASGCAPSYSLDSPHYGSHDQGRQLGRCCRRRRRWPQCRGAMGTVLPNICGCPWFSAVQLPQTAF